MKTVSQHDMSPRFPLEINRGATRAERKELGKLARQKTPLKSHAEQTILQTGRDIISILEKSNEGRVKELVPIRHGRMLVNPFTFYRGSASLMAFDLATTPTSGFKVQACGDCHIQNFGAYATPERRIVIDINDFDETLPAPWEWDVKRLAASLVLAAVTNGLPMDVGEDAAYRMAQSYREYMAELAAMTHLEVWYAHVDIKELQEELEGAKLKRNKIILQEAMKKSSPEILMEKFTKITQDGIRFKDIPPLLCHVDEAGASEQAKQAIKEYRGTLRDHRRILLDRYEIVDLARKVVGIGSVGTQCFIVLLASSEEDFLILQVKEARASVLEPYAGKSKFKHHGERVVDGQKIMQAASDMFLGWTTAQKPPYIHYFVRQLRDVKVGVDTTFWDKPQFKLGANFAGRILARAHARSGDAAVLRGYMGKTEEFDEAIAAYATRYAKQTEHDYSQFVSACKSGTLKSESID